MASTYQAIATQTLGSSAAAVTFSSIPSTYTDLVLVCVAGGNNAGYTMTMRLNGDSGSNYSVTQVVGPGGGSGASSRESSQTQYNVSSGIGVGTTNGSMLVVSNFQNYANTNINKTIISRVSESSATYPGVSITTGLWRSTAAITSIQLSIVNGTANFNATSTFTLYGIQAA